MSQIVFLLACTVLFVVPLVFVLNSVYQDGVIGRAALLGIAFCSAGLLMEAAFGTAFYIPPIVVLLVSFCAVFLVWHLFRFHRRVLKNRGVAIQ